MTEPGRSGNPMRRRIIRGCGCLFVIVTFAGLAAVLAIVGNVDFPGADALRNAGQQVQDTTGQTSQRADGSSAGAQSPHPTAAAAVPPSSAETRTPATLPPPVRKHLEYKEFMLGLINAERQKAGVPPVAMGRNVAAQLHAEVSLDNCFSGHWGVDGLKPYMRYSLAGGYQANSENASGTDYCIQVSDGYRALDDIEAEIRKMMDGWMNSPGHRRNILDKWHRKVNIGLAWDRYNITGYQHFEGGYVEFARLPEIRDRNLILSGRATGGLSFSHKDQLGLQIYFDPPPGSLTLGQIARTYCYDSGVLIAGIGRFLIDIDLSNVDLTDLGLSDVELTDIGLDDVSLTDVSFWVEDEFDTTYSPCPDAYDVPSNAPAPGSPDEAFRLWQEALEASQNRSPQPIRVRWLTASRWTAQAREFAVTVDIGDLLTQHGPGVYTTLLWSEIGGQDIPVSQYSIFYRVNPPDTYGPVPGK